MPDLKKVSVVTVFNKGMRFYSTALKSFLYQSYANTEWIIIDNSGKNLIQSKFQRYLAKENRIRIIANSSPLSAQDVFKQGIESADGEYIALLSPFDYWIKDKILRQIAYMERYKAVLSHTSYAFGDDECHLLKIGCYHCERELNLLNYDMQKNPVCLSTIVFRRDYTPLNYGKSDEPFDVMSLLLKSGATSLGISEVMSVCRLFFSQGDQLKIDQIIKDLKQIDTSDSALKVRVLEHHASKALNVEPLKLDPHNCVGHEVIQSLIELQNFKI